MNAPRFDELEQLAIVQRALVAKADESSLSLSSCNLRELAISVQSACRYGWKQSWSTLVLDCLVEPKALACRKLSPLFRPQDF
jgi:hypothetical protein